MRPTGRLHLGNFVGALENWVRLQDAGWTNFHMVADWHMLTTGYEDTSRLQSDIHEMAPDTIVTSPLVFWDPNVRYILDVWYDHVVNGTPYNAPADKAVFFPMKDGGADLAPLYNFEQKLPKEVIAKYEEVKKQIMDGTLAITFNPGEVKVQ